MAASPRTYQRPDATPGLMINSAAWVEQFCSELGAVILGRLSKSEPERTPSREPGQYCWLMGEDSYTVRSRVGHLFDRAGCQRRSRAEPRGGSHATLPSPNPRVGDELSWPRWVCVLVRSGISLRFAFFAPSLVLGATTRSPSGQRGFRRKSRPVR